MLNFSLIVATRDRAAVLPLFFDAVAELRFPRSGFEVIMVDNSSRDETPGLISAEIARGRFDLRSITEARPGPSHARNLGAESATGRLVLFLDDDVLVDPFLLAAYTAAAASSPILQGRVNLRMECPRPVWLTDDMAAFLGQLTEGPLPAPLGGSMRSGNMAVERKVFLDLGGFRTDLGPGGVGMGEDTEFGLRAAARGFSPWYVPDAIVEHLIPPERVTRRAILRRFYRSGLAQPLITRFNDSSFRLALHLLRTGATTAFAAAFARDGAEQMTALCDFAQRCGRARGILLQRRRRE